jgi:uncharacterized membrane protein
LFAIELLLIVDEAHRDRESERLDVSPMKYTQTATLLIVTVTAGLIAGLMFGYACSVMPGLGRSSDRTLIEAMQNISKAIINGWFMLPFLGTIPLLALAVFLAWRGHGRSALPWLIAALALYLIALFITSGLNVPLNAQLEKAGDPSHIGNLAAVRHHFEGKWVAGNIARTLFHLAAFACLLCALVLYGGNRGHVDHAHAQPGPASMASEARGAGYLPQLGRQRLRATSRHRCHEPCAAGNDLARRTFLVAGPPDKRWPERLGTGAMALSSYLLPK